MRASVFPLFAPTVAAYCQTIQAPSGWLNTREHERKWERGYLLHFSDRQRQNMAKRSA